MKRLFLAGVCAWSLLAQQAAATELDPPRIAEHIKVLSSDAFEGRGPATAGEKKAVAYMISQFRSVGLTPGVI